jgi:flagellar protein FliS
MHQGGEIAQNLFALYSYCYNELVMANVEDNVEALDRAVKVLTDLRSSWVELEIMYRTKVQDQEDVSQTSKAA